MSTSMRDELILESSSPEQTMSVGRAIGACCQVGDIIALDGELGAGKTQFVRGLAEGLGLDPRHVSSPTFVMVQEYEHAGEGGQADLPVLVHIDAYRLRSAEDLESIGWDCDGAELRDQAVVAIEWASLIRPALGADYLSVAIAHESQGRRISLSPSGLWSDRMKQVVRALHDVGCSAE